MTEPVDPTAGTWHDQAPAVATAAATALRLKATDPDRDRLEPLARAAMRAIDLRLDLRAVATRMVYLDGGAEVITYATDDAPADVVEAAHQVTRDLFRRKDAPFGVLNAWSQTGEAIRISRDQLAGVDSLLQPHIEGWGIA
jgi:hypothetical protein